MHVLIMWPGKQITTERSTFDGCPAAACQGDGMCALASASGSDSRTTQEYGSSGMQWEVVHMAAAPSAVRSCSAGRASSAISTSYGATCRRHRPIGAVAHEYGSAGLHCLTCNSMHVVMTVECQRLGEEHSKLRVRGMASSKSDEFKHRGVSISSRSGCGRHVLCSARHVKVTLLESKTGSHSRSHH